MQLKDLSKLSIIIACLCLMISMMIILSMPRVSGYELSIYDAFPWYFWFFFLLSIIFGVGIIIMALINDTVQNLWSVGLLILILSNSLILLLPLFRGYSYGGGADADIFSHVGFIKEIILTHHFSENNFYPVVHLIAYALTSFTGFRLTSILFLIPVLFSAFYISGVYLLATILSKNQKQTILITGLACVLLFGGFHHSILPSFLSFTLLPVLLYIYLKRDENDCRVETTIMLLIFCFFLVFFHPMTTLIAIFIFFLTYVANTFIKLVNPYLNTYIDRITRERAHNMILLLVISFLTWYTSFQEGRSDITGIIRMLFIRPEWGVTSEYISPLAQAQINLFQLGELVLFRYGSILIYSLIGGIGVLIVLKRFFLNREIESLSFFYAIHVVGLFSVGLIMMTGYFYNFDPLRVFRFYLMMVTIFNGIILYRLLQKTQIIWGRITRRHLQMGIGVILCFCCIISIFNIYASPVIWQPNRQFTKENYLGSEWMVEHRQQGIQISHDIGTDIRRMDHLLNGLNENNLFLECRFLDIPTHFGYHEQDTLWKSYENNETYLISSLNGRQAVHAFPQYIRDKVDQYTQEDYYQLHDDTSAVKLYSNGGVDCWFIPENR